MFCVCERELNDMMYKVPITLLGRGELLNYYTKRKKSIILHILGKNM